MSIRKIERKAILGNLGVDERIILKWITKKLDCKLCSGFIFIRTEANEHGN
jgi:hypothetical protein